MLDSFFKIRTIDERQHLLFNERSSQYRRKFERQRMIKITMDRYVHVTDDSLTQAVRQFEQNRAI